MQDDLIVELKTLDVYSPIELQEVEAQDNLSMLDLDEIVEDELEDLLSNLNFDNYVNASFTCCEQDMVKDTYDSNEGPIA